ncbi:MAG: diguanylate cyclase [Campylobacterota bacterium]|nr:diguanylate cyclase [Campylobacterota bacterium]
MINVVPSTSTLLIVDDNPSNIMLLLEHLDEFDVIVAKDGLSALEIIEDEHIDLVLLDIMMPGIDGYEVCKQIRANESSTNLSIIFITAKTDEQSIEKAYEVGGNDYISKPFKPKELLARVNRELELKHLIEHLTFIASRDPMTGIFNRRHFFKLGLKLFSERYDNLHAVILDIDNFKRVNDTHGHPVGDIVIKTISKAIGQRLEEDDIFGRLGGEEFAILTCGSDEAIKNKMEDIRISIENLSITADTGIKIPVSISNGIASANKSINSLDELLKNADDALYEAKHTGRNKTIFRS